MDSMRGLQQKLLDGNRENRVLDHEISVLKVQIMQEYKKSGAGGFGFARYLYMGVGMFVGGLLMAIVQSRL